MAPLPITSADRGAVSTLSNPTFHRVTNKGIKLNRRCLSYGRVFDVAVMSSDLSLQWVIWCSSWAGLHARSYVGVMIAHNRLRSQSV